MNEHGRKMPFAQAGERLRKIRNDLGLSQKSVARFIGMTQSNYSKIERGAFPPNKAHLYLLRDNFNINPDWILEGVPPVFLEQKFAEHFLVPILSRFPENPVEGWQNSFRPASANAFVLHPALCTRGKLVAAAMPDSSMSPVIKKGDIIIIDPLKQFESGIAVLADSSGILVRNIRTLANGRRLLWPANPDFAETELPPGDRRQLFVPFKIMSLKEI